MILLFGCIFALVALPMIALAFSAFSADRKIKRWPRAPGVVTSSRLETSIGSYQDSSGYHRSYNKYAPVVAYTYTVNHQTFEGTQVAREPITSSKRKAEKHIAQYAAGNNVSVYCDPADPTTAYLEVRWSIAGCFLLVFGTGFLIPALGLWIAYFYI